VVQRIGKSDTAHHLLSIGAMVMDRSPFRQTARHRVARDRGRGHPQLDSATLVTAVQEEKTISVNRKARHEFSIEESFEAGIVLTGTEIKSVRAGRVSLADAYARVDDGEAWLVGANISPWETGNRYNHDPKRPRKLLLHRDEIVALLTRTKSKGLTLVPLKMYITGRGRAKLEIGLARGKQQHDRRRDIAERDARRDIERAIVDARGRNR
jgi:SsrA-binding protein